MEPWVQAVLIFCIMLVLVAVAAQVEKWRSSNAREREEQLRLTILYRRWEGLLTEGDRTTALLELRDERAALERRGAGITERSASAQANN